MTQLGAAMSPARSRAPAALLCVFVGAVLTYQLSGARDLAPPSFAAWYGFFAATCLAGFRILSAERPGKTPVTIPVLSLGSGILVIALSPVGAQPALAALFGAAVEELIFRRELPAVLAMSFGESHAHIRLLGAIVTSQVSFALLHSAADPMDSWGAVARVIQLLGAGLWLSIVYRCSGFWSAVAVHFAANALLTTGLVGTFVRPSAAVVSVSACSAIFALVLWVRIEAKLESHPELQNLR